MLPLAGSAIVRGDRGWRFAGTAFEGRQSRRELRDIPVCQRLLDGERLYVDIIETNPPFTIWLYLPAVYLANLLPMLPCRVSGSRLRLCDLSRTGWAWPR